jgi:hypothetical protein
MQFFNLIFQLGVLFSVYGFLWFFIDLILKMLVGARKRTIGEVYLIKSVKYLFLVNVTFLFCLDIHEERVTLNNLLPSAIVLLVYFIGKFQKKQEQLKFLASIGKDYFRDVFNIKAEIVLIIISISFFATFIYFPQFASNVVANWFHERIIELETTLLLGFIFKIVGFFFLISMLLKMLNALLYIFTGKPLMEINSLITKGKTRSKEDKFDDFEEVE